MDQESRRTTRRGERGSPETPPRCQLRQRPLPSSSNSFPSPAPKEARTDPRLNPPPPSQLLQARTPNPERNYPGGWLGVNRHLEQRTKGKESHKAGRLGSRGLVPLSPHPLAKCVCSWNAGGEAGSLRTCSARRTAARAARARRGRPEVASVSRTQPSPLQGRRLHTHAYTHARPHAPRPPRGMWSCPPHRTPPPSLLQRPRRSPAPNLLPGRPAERQPLQPALELRC